MIRKKGLAVAIALLPLAAQADITNATLYPSHAEVTWQEVHQVEPGTGVLEIDGLPMSLQESGLQVSLIGMSGTTVHQVQVDQVEQVEFVADETRRIQGQLEKTKDRIQAYEDDIRAWNQQVTLMTRSAEQPGDISASELNEMAKAVKETTQVALSQIRDIRQAMARDEALRDRLNRELAQVQHSARASKRVRVRYQAPAAGDLTANLVFQTPQASWRSEYNARLTTELEGRPGGEITLEHLAVVRQTTGTDWKGVELRLSTANARRGTAMPDLSAWVVRMDDSVVGRSRAVQADSMMMESAKSAPTVSQRQSSFTQHYRLAQPVDIPSGRSGQRLTVAQHNIPADLATWTTPVLDPTGYLHATGLFESDAPVPAGPVTLYRDGQSVGQALLPELADGKRLSLGFGVDEGISVRVVNELERTGEEGVWSSENVLRRQNRFEITNHHQGAVQVRVFDRLPVSQQDAMTIQPLQITKPIEREVDDKKGVMAWDRVVPPGKSLSIQSGFEVRVPEGQELPRL